MTIAHLALDGHVLWYPFVALALPVLIVVLLTRIDAARHRAADRREHELPALT